MSGETKPDQSTSLPVFFVRAISGVYLVGCLLGPTIIRGITGESEGRSLLATLFRWDFQPGRAADAIDLFVVPVTFIFALVLFVRTFAKKEPVATPAPAIRPKQDLPSFLQDK